MPTVFKALGRVLVVASALAVVTRTVARHWARPKLVHMQFSGTLDATIHGVPRLIQFRGSAAWDPASTPIWIGEEGVGSTTHHVRWAQYTYQDLRFWLDFVEYSSTLRADTVLNLAREFSQDRSRMALDLYFQPGTQFAATALITFRGALDGPELLFSPDAPPTSLAFLPDVTERSSYIQFQFGSGPGTFVATA